MHQYKKLLAGLFIIAATTSFAQNIGVNTVTPDASAALEIKSTTKGLLIPRLSSTQRNAIASPATGLLVFDNSTNSFWFKSATNWIELVDTLNNTWKRNGNNTYLNNTGNVGIGTNMPNYDLHINRIDPSIGFTDVDDNHFSGSISGDSTDLIINTYRKPTFSNNKAGNLILQTGNTTSSAGNVGIGTSTPSAKLEVNGSLKLHGSITNAATGTTNLLPKCFGRIEADAYIVSGSGNYTVSNTSSGVYEIFGDFSSYDIVIATAMSDPFSPKVVRGHVPFSISGITRIYVYVYKLDGTPANGNFSFIVY